MKRFLSALLVAVAAFVQTPAHATVFQVASDSAMTYANNNADTPGDTVLVADGTYTVAPMPKWSSGTEADPIVYIGDPDTLTDVVVPSPSASALWSINRPWPSWVKWTGFYFNTPFYVSPNQKNLNNRDAGLAEGVITGDSLTFNLFEDGLYMGGFTQLAVEDCQVGTGGTNAEFQIKGDFAYYIEVYSNSSFKRNTMYLRGSKGAGEHLFYTHGWWYTGKFITGNTFEDNYARAVLTGSTASTTGNPVGFAFHQLQDNTLSGNTWVYADSSTGAGAAASGVAWYWRDLSGKNTYDADTFIVMPTNSPVRWEFTAHGNDNDPYAGNTWNDCVFVNQTASASHAAFYWQDGLAGEVYRRCLFLSDNGRGLETSWVRPITTGSNNPKSIFDHCTFAIGGTPAVFDFDLTGSWVEWRSPVEITNCLFFTDQTNPSPETALKLTYNFPINPDLTTNYNQYAHLGGATTSILRNNSGAINFYAPGESGGHCLDWTQDCDSQYGAPIIADSTLVYLTFDDTPTAGSPLIANGQGGSDIGRIVYTSTPVDTFPPDTVSDLFAIAAYESHVTLSWTEVGDDSTAGQAAEYVIAFSKDSTITNANFFSGGTIYLQYGTPKAPSTLEIVNVAGLAAGTTHRFAVKVRDEVLGQWSYISNIATIATKPRTPGGGTSEIDIN